MLSTFSSRFGSLTLGMSFVGSALGASFTPPSPDAACAQFKAVACTAQARQLEASFKTGASLRLKLSSARAQSNPSQNLSALQSYWRLGIQCANAADAQDSKMQVAHEQGMKAFNTLHPLFKTMGELSTKRNFPGVADAGKTCQTNAEAAVQALGVCSAAFAVAQADQQAALPIAQACAQDIRRVQQSLKDYVANLYQNNELKTKQGSALGQVHGDWEKLDRALSEMTRQPSFSVGTATSLKSFGDITFSLQLKSDQVKMGGECAVRRDDADKERPACDGGRNFGERNMRNENDAMPEGNSGESTSPTTVVADPEQQTQPAAPEIEPTAPVASVEPPKDKPDAAVEEPDSGGQVSSPYGSNPNANMGVNPQQQQLQDQRAQLEAERDDLRRQAAQLAQQAGQAAQQAANQAGGDEHGDKGSPQQQQAKSDPAKPTDDSAAKAKLAQLQDELKKKSQEIAAKEKELKDTASPFKQGDPENPTVSQGDAKSGNTTVVTTGSSSGNNNQALASGNTGSGTTDSAQGAVGRALVVAQQASPAKGGLRSLAQQPAAQASGTTTFTAFKLDCNTGLGKCSKIPIACGSNGLSADDQTTCDNEAAKRAKNKKRALVGVENP